VTLAPCLERLDEAIDAASSLGVTVDDAAVVRDTARERLRFAGSTYLLALVGGTGVGKSSLLNALAGARVSAAGARRPTTSAPVAWVPAAARAEIDPLLAWLAVAEVVAHDAGMLGGVAVLDLPDLDSIAPEHRARVDELLPRVDAVLWVTDHEKYQDAVLHDAYLRTWGPRLVRQAVVLNKVDLLAPPDADRVRTDLGRQLAREGVTDAPVIPASATSGADGVAALRAWLAAGVDAKQVIAERLARESRVAVTALAARAGVEASDEPAALVPPRRRQVAIDDVVAEVLRTIDLAGLERQAVSATRLASRPRGGGPIGQALALVYRASGRAEVAADPAGYLRRWRSRGGLDRATEPLRRLVSEAMPTLPAGARPALAAIAHGPTVQGRLTEAIDRAVVTEAGTYRPPTSRLWPVLGIAQYAATAALVLGIIWLVAAWAGLGGDAAPVEVPILGSLPMPVLLVTGGLFGGFLIGRLLAAHAGWLGRRWAGRLRASVSAAVAERLGEAVLGPLDALEAARTRVARAAAAAVRECG
jgi:energy-coupling factor transporter ATP-binding protein EcfA2